MNSSRIKSNKATESKSKVYRPSILEPLFLSLVVILLISLFVANSRSRGVFMVFLIITTLILTISVLKRVLNRDYVKITKDEIVIRQMRQEKHFIWKDVQRIKILEYTGPHGYGVRNVFVELYYDVSNPALYYYFSLSGTGAKSDDFVKQIVKLSGINRFAETQIIRERDVI